MEYVSQTRAVKFVETWLELFFHCRLYFQSSRIETIWCLFLREQENDMSAGCCVCNFCSHCFNSSIYVCGTLWCSLIICFSSSWRLSFSRASPKGTGEAQLNPDSHAWLLMEIDLPYFSISFHSRLPARYSSTFLLSSWFITGLAMIWSGSHTYY